MSWFIVTKKNYDSAIIVINEYKVKYLLYLGY